MPVARRKSDQDGLFNLARSKRTELAVDKAIRGAQKVGTLDTELDAGMTVLARVLARAIDQTSSTGGDRWLLPRLVGELREILIRLRLDPTVRGVGRDEIADLIASLARPEPGDPDAGAAAVGDTPQP